MVINGTGCKSGFFRRIISFIESEGKVMRGERGGEEKEEIVRR